MKLKLICNENVKENQEMCIKGNEESCIKLSTRRSHVSDY